MFSMLRSSPSERPAPPGGTGDAFTAYVREELMTIGQEVAELQRALQEAQKLSESKDMLIAELRGELRTLLAEAERLKEAVEDAKSGKNPEGFQYNPASYNSANIQRLLTTPAAAPPPPPPPQTRQAPAPQPGGFMSFFSSEAPETERRVLSDRSLHNAAGGQSVHGPRVANLRVMGYPQRNEPLRAAADVSGTAIWTWFRKREGRQDYEVIQGANASEYIPSLDDLGCSLQVGVQAVGADGSRSDMMRVDAGSLPSDSSFETAAQEYWNKGRVDFSTLRAKEAGQLVQKTLTLKRDQISIKKTKAAKLGRTDKLVFPYNKCQCQANAANAAEFGIATTDGKRFEFLAGNPQERDFVIFCFRRFQQMAMGGRR
eukprot:tig00020723_g13478.t1